MDFYDPTSETSSTGEEVTGILADTYISGLQGERSAMKKAVGCPVETTLRVIGGRWKVLVIHQLLDGPRRFGALGKALSGVSARTLAKQLRELEADGVVDRNVLRVMPPMVEYSLTAEGRKLTPILLAMHEWGEAYERAEASRGDRTEGESPDERPVPSVDDDRR